MEWKIGEIRQVNGEWYQCIEGNSCKNCAFDGRKCYLYYDGTDDQIGECCYDRRKDNKDVIFKKLEKVGEPYYNSDKKLCQQYKCYTEPLIADEIVYVFADNRAVIEIKQNKEDMEEYRMYDAKEDIPEFDKVVDECLFGEDKLNLKLFDLEAAKAGKPVCTRDGRKARIICFDVKGDKPIIALIEYEIDERPCSYFANGRFYSNPNEDNDADLMMLPEKKEGWVNVYKGGLLDTKSYPTKKEAFDAACSMDYVDTVKISWEE